MKCWDHDSEIMTARQWNCSVKLRGCCPINACLNIHLKRCQISRNCKLQIPRKCHVQKKTHHGLLVYMVSQEVMKRHSDPLSPPTASLCWWWRCPKHLGLPVCWTVQHAFKYALSFHIPVFFSPVVIHPVNVLDVDSWTLHPCGMLPDFETRLGWEKRNPNQSMTLVGGGMTGDNNRFTAGGPAHRRCPEGVWWWEVSIRHGPIGFIYTSGSQTSKREMSSPQQNCTCGNFIGNYILWPSMRFKIID